MKAKIYKIANSHLLGLEIIPEDGYEEMAAETYFKQECAARTDSSEQPFPEFVVKAWREPRD